MVSPPDTDTRNRSLEERVSRLEGGFEHLATKADIERVIAMIQGIGTENGGLRTEVRTGIGKLRTEIERDRAEIIKVIVRTAGVGMALMAVGFAFLRLTGTG